MGDMGNVCCLKRKPKKKITLLLVGLDNAGKTVAAKNLAGEDVQTVMPTVGFSVVNLSYREFSVALFDLGGGSNIRGIWDKYFVYAHGIIYVVDSSDYKRLDETKEVLHNLLSHEKVSGKPLIVLANKQDSEDALDEIDIIDKLQLEKLVNNKQCPTLVQSCAATEKNSKSKLDPGIKKAYHWLLNYVIREYKELNERVEIDVAQQENFEKQTRLETIQRLKLLNEATKADDDIIELYSDYAQKVNGINERLNDPQTEVVNDTSSIISSEESLPQVYHVNIEERKKPERPKSALQMVKEQLELEQTTRKSALKTLKSNRTVPANIYGVKLPHSATVHRKESVIEGRNLKSAGDSIFIVSHLPNAVPPSDCGDMFQRNLFRLNNFERNLKLPPLKVGGKESKEETTLRDRYNDENAISVVEVD